MNEVIHTMTRKNITLNLSEPLYTLGESMLILSYEQIHEQNKTVLKSLAITFYRLVSTSSRTKALDNRAPTSFRR